MTQSLTDWLQHSRVVVVGVDAVTRRVWEELTSPEW